MVLVKSQNQGRWDLSVERSVVMTSIVMVLTPGHRVDSRRLSLSHPGDLDIIVSPVEHRQTGSSLPGPKGLRQLPQVAGMPYRVTVTRTRLTAGDQ